MLQTYLLTLLAPLLGGGNSLANSKLAENQFFTKDYTTVLKGLCCLIVIYVHVHEPYTNALQDAIGSFAYVCVTLFFLVSAYGMMLSVERKKDYLKNFWRNRLVALLIPAFLINIVSFCFGIVNKNTYNLSLLYHLNGYVAVLLQWCLWLYIVILCRNRWFPQKKMMADWILIAGVLVSSLYLYFFVEAKFSAQSGWCFERMGLAWGVLLYRYFDKIVEWMDHHRAIKVVILTAIGGILGVAYLKYKPVYFWGAYLLKIVLGVALITLLFTATSNRRCGDRLSNWLGDVSYEVYLSHGMVMGALALWLPKYVDSGVFIFTTVIVTLLLSTIVHSVGKPIVNKLRM